MSAPSPAAWRWARSLRTRWWCRRRRRGRRVRPAAQRLSYVEEPHVIGVRRDEVLAQLDVVAHKDAAHLIGDGSFLDVDLQERATRRIHGGDTQLAEVHLAQALQAVELV